MKNRLKLLFICSRNQLRSPTAEDIWKKNPSYEARSAGTSPNAKRTVSPADIRWANQIFVMEAKHKNRLIAEFTRLIENKSIHVLDIPDDYRYMDEELVDILERKVNQILGNPRFSG